MKPVTEGEVRTIHPEVFNEMTVEAAFAMLEIAKELRDGTIKRKEFCMIHYHGPTNDPECGTSHCIAGWIQTKLGIPSSRLRTDKFLGFIKPNSISEWPSALAHLFGGSHKSDPQLAADAIEQYLFKHAKLAWYSK